MFLDIFIKRNESTCCIEGDYVKNGNGPRFFSFCDVVMSHARIFFGAPSRQDLLNSTQEFSWRDIDCEVEVEVEQEPEPQLFPFQHATLEAASRRISLLYQNVIFDHTEDVELLDDDAEGSVDELEQGEPGRALKGKHIN